jgi:hypothetical protein
VVNINCPKYPGYDKPGGGGYDDDGDSIPNINDPNAPNFNEPGGGGDTGYCGKDTFNISCPSYPHYSDPRYILDTDITVTYGAKPFELHLVISIADSVQKYTEWLSSDTLVATVSEAGQVSITGAGKAQITATLPIMGYKILLANVRLEVRKRQLAADIWVDTAKAYDGNRSAGASIGKLTGLLPQDSGMVAVAVTALFDNADAGSGKAIAVTCTITGERAHCYLPPAPDTLRSGKIDAALMVSMEINGEAQEVRDTMEYVTPCGENVQEIQISFTLAPDVTADILGNNLFIDARRPLRRDTAITLTTPSGQQKQYMLTLEKPFELMQVVNVQLSGRLLMVIRNPEHNGSFDIQEVSWQRKVAGRWITVGRNFYYVSESGMAITDTMRALLRVAGEEKVVSTCPYIGKYLPEENHQEMVYPNPVATGGVIYANESVLVNERGEDRYTRFRLFNSQGQVMHIGNASELREGLSMPFIPGMYYLLLEGATGYKLLKVAVAQQSTVQRTSADKARQEAGAGKKSKPKVTVAR